jgi:hypothetical protein
MRERDRERERELDPKDFSINTWLLTGENLLKKKIKWRKLRRFLFPSLLS